MGWPREHAALDPTSPLRIEIDPHRNRHVATFGRALADEHLALPRGAHQHFGLPLHLRGHRLLIDLRAAPALAALLTKGFNVACSSMSEGWP